MITDPGATAAKRHGVRRSHRWPTVRRAYLRSHSACELCGCKKKLEVHHRIPFHVSSLLGRPDLELDARNLITLCSDSDHEHHVLLGHLGDYQSYFRTIPWGARRLGRMKKPEIMKDPAWRRRSSKRPKSMNKLPPIEAHKLQQWVIRKFPLKK